MEIAQVHDLLVGEVVPGLIITITFNKMPKLLNFNCLVNIIHYKSSFSINLALPSHRPPENEQDSL